MESQLVPQAIPVASVKAVEPSADSCNDACNTNTTCRHLIPRRPATFLVLAPTTSTSHPRSAPVRDAKITPPAVEAGPNDKWLVSELTAPVVQAAAASEPVKATPVIDESLKTRRSSSVGSDGSAQPRFLKLQPVLFGGEPGETDYS